MIVTSRVNGPCGALLHLDKSVVGCSSLRFLAGGLPLSPSRKVLVSVLRLKTVASRYEPFYIWYLSIHILI